MVQLVPQFTPAGLEVTLPSPTFSTVNGHVMGDMVASVTSTSAYGVSTLTFAAYVPVETLHRSALSPYNATLNCP